MKLIIPFSSKPKYKLCGYIVSTLISFETKAQSWIKNISGQSVIEMKKCVGYLKKNLNKYRNVTE